MFWAAVMVSPFVLKGQKQDSVRLLDPKDFPSDTTVDDMDETYGRPFGVNEKYKMKYIRKYVRAGFSGHIVVDPVSGAATVQNNVLAWSMLTQPVKDSIIAGKKKVRLTDVPPSPSTYLADMVVDTAGIDSIYFWNTSSYKLFEVPSLLPYNTARVVPYVNTGGRLYAGNNYFKADTNTTSGGQARLRILINNPTGDIGEGDTYSSLSVRTGDALGSEAIANFGDQALTQATTGYDAIFQTYRSGGTFAAKSNITNGVTTGKFQFRAQVNGASRVLGNIYNVYTGDGVTINSQMFGTSAVAGSIVAGWKLDETSRFWLGSGADDFYFPTSGPTLVNGRIYSQEWSTTGVASTPAWKETQYGVFSGTTDASGDIAPSFAVMAGQTYAAVVTVEGTTAYQTTVHTKAQNTFKVRLYDAATGAALGAGVNVTISYIVKLP